MGIYLLEQQFLTYESVLFMFYTTLKKS